MTSIAENHAQYLERLADRRRHPECCAPQRHDDEEYAYHPDHVEHGRGIGGGSLPECQRMSALGDNHVTREGLGVVGREP
jgi:hypothetical protein